MFLIFNEGVLVGGLEQLRWPNPPFSGAAILSERGHVFASLAMAGTFPHLFADHLPGSRLNIVGHLKCWDSSHERHLFISRSDKVNFYVEGLIDGSNEVYTFMHGLMKQQYPKPILVVDEATKVFQHEPPSWDSLHAVLELCAGFGGMSQGISACGFHTVAAVDFNEKFCQLYKKQHDVETVVGDVCSMETVCKIWHLAKGVGTIAAGFACQPFSKLGDQKGGLDIRALSLRGILETAFYLQVQVLILECVTAAANDAFVKDEIRRFLEVTGFCCSQTELHLQDVWPSRRSRAWWLITSPFLGQVPLVPWPTSHVVSKVLHVLPQILPWDDLDEKLLALLPEELDAFGAESADFAKYLLNFEGCAPCALHAWGSQVVGCQCGCRSKGPSPFRLSDKGLFGLLVYSASFHRQLRHIHPCECNALNGFDPVVDFGANPRLTLAASGQMASPLQTAWIFAVLAERIHQMKQSTSTFSAEAMLQALISWTIMRCRQVWPVSEEPITDVNLRSLMGFWKGFEHLSIHELMHPPRWPQLEGHQVCIASVLDLIIRDAQAKPALVPQPTQVDADENMLEDHEPTPWFEVPEPLVVAPDVSSHECAVVFLHERETPVKFAMPAPCTVQELISAQEKLVGTFSVRRVCNFQGIEVPLNQVVEVGHAVFVDCDPHPFMPRDAGAPVDAVAPMDLCPDHPHGNATTGGVLPAPSAVSPTVVWSQPVLDPNLDAIHATVPYDANEKMPLTSIGNTGDFMLSAAPLLSLQADQFMQLKTPVVMNVSHLWALRQQTLKPDDRCLILQRQHGVWADDEFRYHLGQLVQMHVQYQQRLAKPTVVTCAVLDPLLLTGWVHHGSEGCMSWAESHPEIAREGCPLISCCMLDGHWLPVVMQPVAGVLQIKTWDAPSRDHTSMNLVTERIGHALGFAQVTMVRHHRLFFTSDMCGAMAVAYLIHDLLDVMLPTCHEDVVSVHQKLRNAFALALQHSSTAHRPWIWGSGDNEEDTTLDQSIHEETHALPNAVTSEVRVDRDTISVSHQCISKEERLDLLQAHGKQWGDDEVRFHMLRLMRMRETAPPSDVSGGFVMMDPLLLATWDVAGRALCEAWCRANVEEISQGYQVVAVLYADAHWFPLWFTHQRSTIIAHRIADEKVTSEMVMPVLNVLQECLGFQSAVEHVVPDALPPHDMCGAASIAFISHLLVKSPLPQDPSQLADMHIEMRAEFVEALYEGNCCICPVAWGNGPFGPLVTQLAEELQKHGVPHTKAEQRAQLAIKAIGSDNVSTALKSKTVWRSLKALGSNVKFQFILPDELDAVVQMNKGNPVGKRTKANAPKAKLPVPDAIDPHKLALVEGTFRAQGNVMPQIALQQIGPVACGVALVSLEEAMPYLKAGKSVSCEPLALAVLIPKDAEVTTCLPHTKVMIPCMCVANHEPLLVQAMLVQLGQGLIEKHVAASAISLDQLDVVTVKVMVYHDEFSGQWEDFISSPIKHLVHVFPVLRRCMEKGCQCDCWHNVEELKVRDPIMDVWRRQFLSANFKPVSAQKAEVFSVCLRVPAVILPVLLSQSGLSGAFLEPRSPDGREVLSQYAVVWTPKMSTSEMAHLKQTNPAIIGFARLGERKGLRVLASQAQAVHEVLKPDTTFLPSGPKMQYVAGPFPWGSDRQAIVKALRQVGWSVKALQPMQHVPNRGSMWLLQSVDDPPEAIIQTTHGEVVISKHKENLTQMRSPSNSTVGSASTLSLCGPSVAPSQGDLDPWLASDPWGSYTKTKTAMPTAPATQGMLQLEERIQSAVLAKIPTSMDQDVPDRLVTLEGQVQMLMNKHNTLEGQVNEFSAHSSQQFAVVQQQIQQQSQAFHGQFESHAQGIQAMFSQQMEQIRGLLSKRPRDDTME